MKKWFAYGSLIACSVFLVFATANAQSSSLSGKALLEALQRGGFVLFFRHERTDMSQGSRETNFLDRAAQNSALWTDCDAQRNLNDAGRAGARAQGEAFRALNIEVGDVIASPFCRAWEHAQLGFGRYVLNNEIINTFSLNRNDARRIRAADETRKLISSPPRSGVNTAIIGHQPTFQDVTDIALEEGEAAVVRPLGDGRYEVVARVKTDAWMNLSR
jgi:phosphohistidine phosphatase SixA